MNMFPIRTFLSHSKVQQIYYPALLLHFLLISKFNICYDRAHNGNIASSVRKTGPFNDFVNINNLPLFRCCHINRSWHA
jgi:hypothetical protein